VPTSQYRPNSRAIVYRLDPDAIEAPESLRFPDHLGALARDRLPGLLHAATWGSGQFLVRDTRGRVLHRSVKNSRYVDFQDCAADDWARIWSIPTG
jgi:hypothetical protein